VNYWDLRDAGGTCAAAHTHAETSGNRPPQRRPPGACVPLVHGVSGAWRQNTPHQDGYEMPKLVGLSSTRHNGDGEGRTFCNRAPFTIVPMGRQGPRLGRCSIGAWVHQWKTCHLVNQLGSRIGPSPDPGPYCSDGKSIGKCFRSTSGAPSRSETGLSEPP
jgi:hypothetical protein